MRIYNNIPALQAYNSLTRTNVALSKSIAKLSTGLRINSAADDAAGLAISEKMRAQIRGLDRASSNAQDGISMIQTAEGSLSETTSILQRMRELSVQAANDTLTQQDRGYIQLEIDQLKEEVDRIANTTQFNKKKLLDGSASVLWSSDSLDTKLFVRGGLRQVDQFGQKNVREGNYKVSIDANPGVAEIQKSDIFKIKHKNVLSDLRMDTEQISGVKVDNLPAGNYVVSNAALVKAVTTANTLTERTLGIGTWLAGPTTFSNGGAGFQFGVGSTFSAGARFANGQIFGPGATFCSTVQFQAGSIFAGGSNFAAGSFAQGARFASGAVFGSGTFAAGSRFLAGAVFSAGRLASGSQFAGAAAARFTAGSFAAGATFAVNATFAAGTMYTGGSGATIRSAGVGLVMCASSELSRVGAYRFVAATRINYQDGPGGTIHTAVISAGAAGTTIAMLATRLSGAVNANTIFRLQNSYTISAGATYITTGSDRVTFTSVSAVSTAGYVAQRTVTLGTGAGAYQGGIVTGNNGVGGATATVAAGGAISAATGTTAVAAGVGVTVGTGGTGLKIASGVAGTGGALVGIGSARLTGGGTLSGRGSVINALGLAFATVGVGGATTDGPSTLNNIGTLARTYVSRETLTIDNTNAQRFNNAVVLAAAYTVATSTVNLVNGVKGMNVLNSAPSVARIYQTYGLSGNSTLLPNRYGLGLSLTGVNGFSGTANILLEVMNVDRDSNILTFKAVAQVIKADGTTQAYVIDDLKIKEGEGAKWTAFGIGGELFSLANNAIDLAGYSIGDKLTIGANSLRGGSGVNIAISASQDSSWGGYWGGGALQTMNFSLDASRIRGKDVHLRSFYLNTANGTIHESNVSISFGNRYVPSTVKKELASFKATYIGQTARMDTQLRDLDKFWDANGKFMLVDPQNITMTQGDGSKTSITLYSTDTIGDVAKKLNDAIGSGLGQSKYLDSSVANDAGKFTTFVMNSIANTSEAVQGTFVIRSVINGSNGIISFAGDEDLIKALSLNVIQEAKEDQFNVAIQDAHSGEKVGEAKISGNTAIGILHPNLDFQFKVNADMSTIWNNISKSYDTKAIGKSSYETIIHVADNTAVFQIGANEGEDMAIDIADMGSRALGINRVLVTDQKTAARSITIIDSAIDRVSSSRAKLGAYQNRLDHTISNLTIAAENLTAAESRIRDLDMAKEMMNFTKLNILMQAGNSMLGQANQLPQNVLALLR